MITVEAIGHGRYSGPVVIRASPSDVTTEVRTRVEAAKTMMGEAELHFTAMVVGDLSFRFSLAMTRLGG